MNQSSLNLCRFLFLVLLACGNTFAQEASEEDPKSLFADSANLSEADLSLIEKRQQQKVIGKTEAFSGAAVVMWRSGKTVVDLFAMPMSEIYLETYQEAQNEVARLEKGQAIYPNSSLFSEDKVNAARLHFEKTEKKLKKRVQQIRDAIVKEGKILNAEDIAVLDREIASGKLSVQYKEFLLKAGNKKVMRSIPVILVGYILIMDGIRRHVEASPPKIRPLVPFSKSLDEVIAVDSERSHFTSDESLPEIDHN